MEKVLELTAIAAQDVATNMQRVYVSGEYLVFNHQL